MADSDNPLHCAEVISQIIAQLNKLGDHIYGADMSLHFDDTAVANVSSIMGLTKKLQRAIDRNYYIAQEAQKEAAE